MNVNKLLKRISLGFVLLLTVLVSKAEEIDSLQTKNLENAKQRGGIERFENGQVKVQVNTKMIEQFYESYSKHEYISWSELLKRGDRESLAAFWSAYANADLENEELADIKRKLDEKYKKIEENSEVFETLAKPLLTQVVTEQ